MQVTIKQLLLLCALVLSSCAVDVEGSPPQDLEDSDDALAGRDEALLAAPGVGKALCILQTLGEPGKETAFKARNWRSNLRQPLLPVLPTAEPGSTTILQGTCASQRTICLAIADPVCATVNANAPATYGNRCALKGAVLLAAGETGSARGSVNHAGACGIACFASDSCEKDEYCTVEDGVCNRPPGCGPDAICPAVCTGECAPLAAE